MHTNAVLAFPLLGIVAATAAPMLALLGPGVDGRDRRDAGALRGRRRRRIVAVLLGTALLAAQRPGAEAVSNWVQAGVGALAIAVAAIATRDAGIRTQILAIAVAVLATELVMATRALAGHVPAGSAYAGPAGPARARAGRRGRGRRRRRGWAVLRLGADRLPVLAQVATARR